jgi:hypothetical protein
VLIVLLLARTLATRFEGAIAHDVVQMTVPDTRVGEHDTAESVPNVFNGETRLRMAVISKGACAGHGGFVREVHQRQTSSKNQKRPP